MTDRDELPTHYDMHQATKVGEKATKMQTIKVIGCFIYSDMHQDKDYHKKEKLNAIMAEEGYDSEPNTPNRVNPLQLLNSIQTKPTH